MRVLLTGATGYLGKHLLQGLLGDGHDVVTLVRPDAGDPLARVQAALASTGAPRATSASLTVVAGDVSLPDCGLTPVHRHTLQGCDALIHSAGLTRFDSHLSTALTRQNVVGTQSAYMLADGLGIPHFHHLSTAYVAGTAEGPFTPGDFACGQHFLNPYEASKFEAERWLRAQVASDGPAIAIHRPSIVVGGQPLGASNAVSTVYTFMKAVHFIRACCVRETARGGQRFARLGVGYRGATFHLPLRLAADPDATINLVAIEEVTRSIVNALSTPQRPRLVTNHLTGWDTPLSALAAALMQALELDGLELVPPAVFDRTPRNALEAHLARMTSVYTPYLFRSPTFVGTAIPAPRRLDPVALTIDFMRQLATRAGGRPARAVGGLALDTLAIDTPEDYFAALTRGAVGRSFLARHAYVDAEVEFCLTGLQPDTVRLRFEQGRVTRIPAPSAPAPSTAPDCTYTLETELFMQIVAGERDLRAAFLAGRVRIDGDKELALKFGALLGYYYQHIDTHIMSELTV